MGKLNRKNKLSAEELVNTQVINIDEVRKVAKYERSISKKPAVIFAVLGILLVGMGFGSKAYVVYKENAAKEEQRLQAVAARKAKRKEEAKKIQQEQQKEKKVLVCELSQTSETDGITAKSVFSFYFEDKELIREVKNYNVDRIDGSPNGDASMNALYTAYKGLEALYSNNVIKGYTITTVPHDNSGFILNVEADMKELSFTTLPVDIQNDGQARVDFPAEYTYENINTIATSSGYICK